MDIYFERIKVLIFQKMKKINEHFLKFLFKFNLLQLYAKSSKNRYDKSQLLTLWHYFETALRCMNSRIKQRRSRMPIGITAYCS